jgi:predicted DCC family thiol-disulfide oxidoreductase YuxK
VAIVFFDGVCNLCHAGVRFVLENDPAGYFQITPLESDPAREMLGRFGRTPASFSSIALVEGGRLFENSDAVLRIAAGLRSPWPVFMLLLALPEPFRDRVYRWIADNRYRWFGKRESCAVPAPEWQARFL